jgi:hypothetical protein
MYYRRVAMLFVALTLGCGPTNTNPPVSAPSEDTTAAPEPAGADVRLITAKEFTAEMEARKGKVVLLDLWATW